MINMKRVSFDKLKELQRKPKSIRNVCILAHVDHGKTTLADALVSSNGIISQKMAGKLRYMDSREDEQIRGITMKSSAISLYHQIDNADEYLVNLIDSPGHIDFSGDVSTVVRLCDGAIVVVDVVEGVCPQTYAVLRQAWLQNITPVLVLNKIDRLIVELKMTEEEAELRILQVLEQVNAITGELFTSGVLAKFAKENSESKKLSDEKPSQFNLNEWETGMDDVDDSSLYFSPDQGNVVFASAYDGWGFRTSKFAEIYSKKLGVSERVLKKTIWGDYYLDLKSKCIKKGAKAKGKKSLFVQLVLESVWKVYSAVLILKDKNLIEKIVKTLELNTKVKEADLKSTNQTTVQSTLQSILNQWLPVSKAVLDMVCKQLPDPTSLSDERVNNFLRGSSSSSIKMTSLDSLPLETLKLKDDLLKCGSGNGAPVIAFVSKMFPFEKKFLPKNKPTWFYVHFSNKKKLVGPFPQSPSINRSALALRVPFNIEGSIRSLTMEEILSRRETLMKRRLNEKQNTPIAISPMATRKSPMATTTSPIATTTSPMATTTPAKTNDGDDDDVEGSQSDLNDDHVFIAFARVFSGTLKRGQTLYVFGPKHRPSIVEGLLKKINCENITTTTDVTITTTDVTTTTTGVTTTATDDDDDNDHRKRKLDELLKRNYIGRCTCGDLYILMGREMEEVEEVCAGNIVGIGGLEDHVLKSASLSSNLFCPTFTDLHLDASPIVTVAVEPRYTADMDKLVHGLRLLNQSDPCVEVIVKETGEHVVVGAGEVHLNKCLDDLKDRFARIEINVSAPTVPFRETIVPPPTVDRVNEIIIDQSQKAKRFETNQLLSPFSSSVEMKTSEGWYVKIRAIPIPDGIVKLLNDNSQLLKLAVYRINNFEKSDENIDANIRNDFIEMRKKFAEIRKCENAKREHFSDWDDDFVEKIWSIDVKRNCSNLLVNNVLDYLRPSFWRLAIEDDDRSLYKKFRAFDRSIINGFQMAVDGGPICEEPMYGVCFVVDEWYLQDKNEDGADDDHEDGADDDHEDGDNEDDDDDTKNIKGDFCNFGNKDGDDGGKVEVHDEENDGIRSKKTKKSKEKSKSKFPKSSPMTPAATPATTTTTTTTTTTIDGDEDDLKKDNILIYNGSLLSCVKECCRRAFQKQPQRLVWAMYTCVIQATSEVLGKMYGVLGKRHGRILNEDMREGSNVFEVTSVLPVVESFGFADEFRKKTSGFAVPQLNFSHWETIDIDPYWVPTTEEEYIHFGEKADSGNMARKHMNDVRRRKGLKVQEKLVEFGEKQRTLKKNK